MHHNSFRAYVACALACCVLLLLSDVCGAQEATNPLIRFLTDAEYTSQLKLEYDDNIFLTEDTEDGDLREIFTQTMAYRLPKDNHFFQLKYSGSYTYYNEESTGVLGHYAHMLYSYRPFERFSIGFRDDFNWLQDSTMRRTLGDEVLALGYAQNTPMIQLKHELSPECNYTVDTYYQFLDVRDASNDDYIDNKQLGVTGQLNYNFTADKNVIGFFGLSHRKIWFPQISAKSATSRRFFVGLTHKFPSVVNITQEVGFDDIQMDDDSLNDGDSVDYRVSLETVFSLYTKLRFSYDHNVKNASLRSEYAQYDANTASLGISHAINPKTSAFFDYSYEWQDFSSSDRLPGQANVDRETDIHSLGLTLSRKLNNWLTADASYNYTKRDTDFAREGYTDNKLSVAVTAKY